MKERDFGSSGYDDADDEVDGADLSEFEDYKPYEGDDDVAEIDTDFSFVKGSPKNTRSSEGDDFGEERSNKEAAPDKNEEIKKKKMKEAAPKHNVKDAGKAANKDANKDAAKNNADEAKRSDSGMQKEAKVVERIVIKPIDSSKETLGSAMQDTRAKRIGKMLEKHRETKAEAKAGAGKPSAGKHETVKKSDDEKKSEESRKSHSHIKHGEVKMANKHIAEDKHKADERQKVAVKHKANGKHGNGFARKESSHPKERHLLGKPKSFMKFTIILLIIAVIASLFLIMINVPKKEVIAIIGGEEMTRDFFNKQLNVFIFEQQIPAEYQDKIDKDYYFKLLAFEMAASQEAKRKGIALSDSEAQSRLNKLISDSPYTESTLKIELSKNNVKYEDYIAYAKRAMNVEELLNWAVGNYTASEEEMVLAYQELFERRGVAHILVCYQGSANCASNLSEADALKKARMAYSLAKAGDFAEVAKELSDDDATKALGGDIGYVKRGQLTIELEEKLFSMKNGEISEPIKTPYGFHVMKLYDDSPTYESAKTETKLAIFRTQLMRDANVTFLVTSVSKPAELTTLQKCLVENGAYEDQVVFYYSAKCGPACDEMFAATKTLKAMGYKFYYSEISEKSWLEVMNCFSHKERAIPQFICAGTGEVVIGKISSADLRAFADKCRAAAVGTAASPSLTE